MKHRDRRGGVSIDQASAAPLEHCRQLAHGSASIVNHDFRDDVADGRIVFDYRLRPGPCPTTITLKLMRREGLPVDEPC